MNIYLLEQNKVRGYDTYDSVVVAAENDEDAKTIHPAPYVDKIPAEDGSRVSDSWVNDPDDVEVTLIGKAAKNIERGVICSSFNAG